VGDPKRKALPRGFYNPPMRSWLAILLLMLVPWQLSPAAAGLPAPHESVAHAVVHCTHPSAAASQADVAVHADCGTCHNGCAIALPDEPRRSLASTPAFPPTGPAALPASRPADLPDRPQWNSARG